MKINNFKMYMAKNFFGFGKYLIKNQFVSKLKYFFMMDFYFIMMLLVMTLIFVFYQFFQNNIIFGAVSRKFSDLSALNIAKADVSVLLRNTTYSDFSKEKFEITFDNNLFMVDTSIDVSLHNSLRSRMDKINSSQIAIVVMDPNTGRVITMTGFNKIDPDQNPCINASFPAASVFKIITAAAAVEKCGYTANSVLKFNGCKHTLYKRQIVDRTNRYTNEISLRNSFAQSINPVFGKIGSLYLGERYLKQYGDIFGFNREIAFEIPWDMSNLFIKKDPYHWAEIASGFNRQTTISPLHGAVIASAVVNNGIPVEPTIIDQIIDKNGNLIYVGRAEFLKRAITGGTASVLSQLMVATVTSGTGQKAFKGFQDDEILSRLRIGGKTGSIYNKSHDTRFDWFVGFAENKCGPEKIVVSVVVAHEKYVGVRAGQYARMAIEFYFKKYFEKHSEA